MSRELIERLREAAAQRVASTAMIGADDLSAAADALESLGAAYGGAAEANKYARMVSLLVRLKDTVEALDGTSVENERLVDEYRRVMLQLGS